MSVDHEGVSRAGLKAGTRDRGSSGFRSLIEAALSGIFFKLFGSFMSATRLQRLFRNLGSGSFRMNWRCVRGDGFPRISVFPDSLRNILKSERRWTFKGFQFLPRQ